MSEYWYFLRGGTEQKMAHPKRSSKLSPSGSSLKQNRVCSLKVRGSPKKPVKAKLPPQLFLITPAYPQLSVVINRADARAIRNKTIIDSVDILRKYALPGEGFKLVHKNGKSRSGDEKLCEQGNTLYYILESVDLDLIEIAFDETKSCIRNPNVNFFGRRDCNSLGVYYHVFEIKVNDKIESDEFLKIKSSMGSCYKGDGFRIPYNVYFSSTISDESLFYKYVSRI